MRTMMMFLGAAGILAACAHDDGRTSTATLTSAAPPLETQSPYDVHPEQKLAGDICLREAECNAPGWKNGDDCVRGLAPRIKAELSGWQCDPASTRARYKDCLATVHAEPCSTIQDIEMRVNICRANSACAD